MANLRSPKARRALAGCEAFFATDLDALLREHALTSPELHVLKLFRSAASEVPAYRAFLESHAIDPDTIRSLSDFAQLPALTKDNYHRQHPLADLCRNAELGACDMLSVSSGSTGEPTVWPRSVADEYGTAQRFEQIFAQAFDAASTRTLAVVCFALGSWVGGMYTTACCRHLSAKGYPLTVVTPGNQKPEILRILRALAPMFEQIVLLGYPPFLKDVIDFATAEGFDFPAHRVRLVMAGEVFSEQWRSLVCERIGADDPATATASLYGTADGGVLANETATSIEIRRFLAESPEACRELFGESRLPTLCQFDPFHRYFETEDTSLLFSSDGRVPLVRYKILDRGGVVPFETMHGFLKDHGAKLALNPQHVPALPFVYVFGRSNFAVSFYGANIYPENVAVGIEQPQFMTWVGGKFVMQVAHDSDQNAELQIRIELLPKVSPSDELTTALAASIQKHMELQNSEFLNYTPQERRTPRVILLQHADPEYFPIGVKHRYTR